MSISDIELRRKSYRHNPSLAPHILCSPKLIDDARSENEKVLQKESHSWIGRLKVVVAIISDVNILSEENVATPCI